MDRARDERVGRAAAASALVVVTGYFLGLTRDSLQVYFSPDDLMNLYRGWIGPRSALVRANLLFFLSTPFGRPMGALWYRAIFYFAGFHPFWFHVADLAILIGNIVLTYALARRLSNSRTAGVITALIFSYTPRMGPIYFDTGFIYDVLCYCFYAAALLVYVRVRNGGGLLTYRQSAAVVGLYACALSSKEMAITLPLFLVIYEWLYHKDLVLTIRRQAWLAAVTLVFAMGRASGADSLLHHGSYRPVFTWSRFMETSRHFLADAPAWQVLLLWLILGAAAWLSKSRALRFAALFLFLSPLPVAFIAPREAGQYYVCWFGWSLYGGVAAAGLTRWLTPPQWRDWYRVAMVRGALLLAVLVLLFYPRYKSEGWEAVKGVSLEAPKNRDCVEQLHGLEAGLTPGSRILFLNDPVPADWYNLLFMVRLSYRDRSFTVDRVKQGPVGPESSYDYVFDYRDGRFVETKRP